LNTFSLTFDAARLSNPPVCEKLLEGGRFLLRGNRALCTRAMRDVRGKIPVFGTYLPYHSNFISRKDKGK
jgi:hypothetical protein